MEVSRRTFLKAMGVATLGSAGGCVTAPESLASVLVNDVHTQLNPTLVRSVTPIRSLDELKRTLGRARRDRRSVSIAGGRHAAGGQQFAAGEELLDTRELRRVLH